VHRFLSGLPDFSTSFAVKKVLLQDGISGKYNSIYIAVMAMENIYWFS